MLPCTKLQVVNPRVSYLPHTFMLLRSDSCFKQRRAVVIPSQPVPFQPLIQDVVLAGVEATYTERMTASLQRMTGMLGQSSRGKSGSGSSNRGAPSRKSDANARFAATWFCCSSHTFV